MTKKSHGCSSGVIPLCGVLLKAMIICDRRLFLLRITVLVLSLRAGQFLCSTFSIYSRFGDCACKRLSVVSEMLSATKTSRRTCQGGGLETEKRKQIGVALPLLMNLSPCEPGPAAGFFLLKGSSSSPLLLFVCRLWASGQRQS